MHAKSVADLSVRADGLAPVDIIAAGFPCQSFSQAGHRKGFRDDRGNLFFDIPRIVKEFGSQRPPILLLENVPHLMGGEGGRWYERIVREIQNAGYWFSTDHCKIVDTARVTDLPQRRERIFMAAMSMEAFDCNDFRFPEAGDALQPLGNFIDKSRKKPPECYLASDNRFYKVLSKQIAEGDTKSVYQLRRYYARENKGVCPPLTANMGGGGHNVPFVRDRWGIRRLTVDECAGLQGFANGYAFPENVPEKERYRQIGNTVSVPVVELLGKECVRILRSQRRS